MTRSYSEKKADKNWVYNVSENNNTRFRGNEVFWFYYKFTRKMVEEAGKKEAERRKIKKPSNKDGLV